MFKESLISIESKELLFANLNKELDLVKEVITNQLIKRGFPIEMVNFGIVKNRIEFETVSFQTTPVIFKNIYVGNFGGGISSGKLLRINNNSEIEEMDALRLWIPVHAGYNHFDGGSNSSKLFNVAIHVTDYGVCKGSAEIR